MKLGASILTQDLSQNLIIDGILVGHLTQGNNTEGAAVSIEDKTACHFRISTFSVPSTDD